LLASWLAGWLAGFSGSGRQDTEAAGGPLVLR
jgi:hypothetical protein